ncbi:MAG: hypothetical protein ABW168_23920 [Sedimenticola sp.]
MMIRILCVLCVPELFSIPAKRVFLRGSESIAHKDMGKKRELGAEALHKDGW